MNTFELASSLRLAISNLYKSLRKQMDSTKAYSMTEIETIGHLFRNSKLLPTKLASLTHITTQSMSQILSKMDNAGVIKRTPSKTDKRKVYVSLTPEGREIVLQTRNNRNKWLENAIQNTLTNKEKDTLEEALCIIEKLIEYK